MPESQQKGTNSQNKPSEKTVDEKPSEKGVGPEPTAKEVEAVKEQQNKDAEKELNESSKASAKKAEKDDYDPSTDPIVPDSALADVIRVELKNGESPTLDALRSEEKARKKREEDKK